MLNPNKIAGILAMTFAAFLWSIAGLFIKVIDWNPIAIAGMRSLIASVVIFFYLRRPVIHFSFPQAAAAITNAATMLLFVSANKTTTAANAILLQYTAPVLTALFAVYLLKESVHAEHVAVIPLVIAGMALMFFEELDSGKLLGNALAVMSAVTFSFFLIFMRRQKDHSPLESILLSHWLTGAICLIISFFLPLPDFTLKSLAAVAMLGIVQIGLSAIFFSFAIKRISALSANLIAIIEPVLNPLWVFVVIGEVPGIQVLVGGSVIVAAVTLASIIMARRKADN